MTRLFAAGVGMVGCVAPQDSEQSRDGIYVVVRTGRYSDNNTDSGQRLLMAVVWLSKSSHNGSRLELRSWR